MLAAGRLNVRLQASRCGGLPLAELREAPAEQIRHVNWLCRDSGNRMTRITLEHRS